MTTTGQAAFRRQLVRQGTAAVTRATNGTATSVRCSARTCTGSPRNVSNGEAITAELEWLERSGLAVDLRRPETSFDDLRAWRGETRPPLDREVQSEVECRIKYAGYIARQEREIARLKDLEEQMLPSEVDYVGMEALSREVREKLQRVRPATLGQAARIPGVTPSAIAVLAISLKRRRGHDGKSTARRS